MSESQLFLVKPRHIVSVDLGQSRSQSVVSVIRQSELGASLPFPVFIRRHPMLRPISRCPMSWLR